MIPSEDTVTIGRWQAEYLIARGHPAPERLKSRLDDALNRLKRETLNSALLPLANAEGESVWLIRRLELNLSANIAGDMDRTAGAWARRIAGALDHTLQDGPDGENVLHFPDWAAYLAYFLGDLVEGRAWGRWFYRAFEGLRSLPVSTAARTAILDDPQVGFNALLSLSAGRLASLVESLSEPDAQRVLDGLSVGQSAPVDFNALQEACQRAWRFSLTGERLALLVALAAGRELGHLPGPELATAARVAASSPPPTDAQRGEPPAPDRPLRRHTPFGGIFLLLPELDELPLNVLLEDFPALEGEDSGAALRLLLLARAGGSTRAEMHFNDPLLRDLVGISPRFTPADASAWLNRVRRRTWLHFKAALAESLPGTNDLNYLLAPLDWGIKHTADLPLAQAASTILRRFSERLSGFELSAFPYLFSNLLNFPASLEEDDDRRTAFLGRPPLVLVLQRAGLMRQTYRLGWGDGRKFELYPDA